MKKLAWIVAVLVLCAGGRVSATEVISNYGLAPGGGSPTVGYADGGAGFGFTPLENISVTSLGYSQSGLAGYGSDPAQVSLWDSGGDLLSTALITGNDSAFNQSYYQTVSPVTLDAGDTYFIGAADAETEIWMGNVTSNTFSVSPDITCLGAAVGTNIWEGLQPGTTAFLQVGPNFQYGVAVVPEPSTLALGALGLATLALIARKPRHYIAVHK